MCWMLDRLLSATLIYLALLPALLANARAEPQGFQRTINQAVAEYDAGRFAEARVHFSEAHALSPSARTLRALGMVEFELHHYVESVTYLEQALLSQVKPLDAALRAEAERVLGRAHGEIARLRVILNPAEATLRVDDAAALASSQLVLAPGPHVIEASAPGRQSERRELRLSAGEQQRLEIALTPLPLADGAPAASRSERALIKNPWLWSGVGVAAAALITGLAIGLSARDGTQPAPAYGGDTGMVLSGP
jgi:tetratricopeptide (TPR) repeat protein